MKPAGWWVVSAVPAHGDWSTHGWGMLVTMLPRQGVRGDRDHFMSYQLTEAFSDDVMSLAVSSLLCYSTLIVDNRIVRKSWKDDWLFAVLLYLLTARTYERTPIIYFHSRNVWSIYGLLIWRFYDGRRSTDHAQRSTLVDAEMGAHRWSIPAIRYLNRVKSVKFEFADWNIISEIHNCNSWLVF